MNIRENGKMKVLSLILSLVLIMGLVPSVVFAAPMEELWVNGVDILSAENNTVACGSGKAIYDPTTATLTLDNAVIETPNNGRGIFKNGASDTTNKLIIQLIGDNKIIANEMNPIQSGIYSGGTVSIQGEGSLLIETAYESSNPYGIYAFSGCAINGSRITLRDTSGSDPSFSSGIDVNGTKASLKINSANITIDGYVIGINVPSGDVTVKGSSITVTNADNGISGGNVIDNFIIEGSVLDFTGDGVTSVGLLNGHEIQIDSSLVKILSKNSNAIYTDGAISVRNGSVLELTGFYPALFSTLDTIITNSTMKAFSTDDSGIYSRANIIINGTSDILARGHWAGINANGNITINSGKVYSTSSNDMGIYLRGIFTMNGGDLYAQGAQGFAAIGARHTKQDGDTNPIERIKVNSNYADVGGGKVSVSDWFTGSSEGIPWSRSWTSFVARDDDKLASDRSNALNEITIKIKPADYTAVDGAIAKIPGDLSNYTNESVKVVNDAKSDVIRGKDITEQSVVDGYAKAIEDAVGALALKAADYSKVEEAIAKIPADLSIYTEATVNAVTAAKDAVVRGRVITEQPLVDGYAKAIEDAVDALLVKPVDPDKDKKFDYIEDLRTGARAEYEDRSKFDANITLNVTARSKEEIDQTKNDLAKVAKGFTLAGLYDIKLMKDGVAIQPDGMIRVSIPLTVEMQAMSDLKVVYIDDEGKITIIPSQIVDNKIVFLTDHFSDYGIIGKIKTDSESIKVPQTGDISNMVLLFMLMFISGAGLFGMALYGKKRSKTK